MQSSHASGIVSTANNGNAVWLPLTSLSANIFITDVSSRTILSQTYIQNGPIMLAEAYYIFPVPARAAVGSFRMETDNGVTLEGIVKEISDAKKDYEQAMSENRLAGLLEQYRQDIFVVSIGYLQPSTTITVMISYVMDLSDNDQDDTIRYQLSSHVAGRYGAPSTSVIYPIKSTTHRARLNITADIQMSGTILHVHSNRSLADMVVPHMRRNTAGDTFHVARKHFSSEDVCLGNDFLLVVQAMDLDVSRCFAERDGSSTALSLTIVPRFRPTRSHNNREYLFLIDRSGSMAGNKIQMAKDALKLLLRSLPADGSYFNVYSFGSTYFSLWPSSRPLNEFSRSEAIAHVEHMDADLHGTELLPALQNVVSTRNLTMPTSVFVLTDGFISCEGAAISCVNSATVSATAANPFRLFTLGVGDGASTNLCEGLARAGKGECFMTLAGEDISAKCVRILGGMEYPDVKDIVVDWGIRPEQVQQAPFQLFVTPNKRLHVTAIFSQGQSAPSHVTLTARLSDNSLVEYRVPVTSVLPLRQSLVEEIFGAPVDLPPLIHTLAAHRLILDYERELVPPFSIPGWHTLTPDARRDLVNNLIVQLGIRYQITSSRTSFIATSAPVTRSRRGTTAQAKNGNRTNGGASNTASSGSNQNSTPSSVHGSRPGPPPTNNGGPPNGNSSRTGSQSQTSSTSHNPPTANGGGSNHSHSGSTVSGNGGGRSPQKNTPPSSQRSSSPGASGMPGAFKSSPPRRQDPPSNDVPSDFFFQSSSTEPDELLYLFGGNIPPVLCIAPALKQELVFVSWFKSLRSFIFKPRNNISNQAFTTRHQVAPFATVDNKDDPAFREALGALSSLQSLDGLYDIHDMDRFSNVTGIPAVQIITLPPDVLSVIGSIDKSASIWATAIAIAFLRERFASHWVTWKVLARKSIEAGSRGCGGNAIFNKIVAHAVALFQ